MASQGKGKKSRQPRASGRGLLFLVAAMFAASAITRFAGAPGHAVAQELAALRAEAERPPAGHETASPAEDQAELPERLAAMLQELKARRAALQERERRLAERQKAVELAEARLREDLQALRQAREALSATISQASTAAEDDLKRLTSVYENMKPKQAAELFEKMAPEFAAGFIGRMRPDAAAQIMAGMSPEAAYTISVILAGRNARAPKE